jgi:hypothetical protein
VLVEHAHLRRRITRHVCGAVAGGKRRATAHAEELFVRAAFEGLNVPALVRAGTPRRWRRAGSDVDLLAVLTYPCILVGGGVVCWADGSPASARNLRQDETTETTERRQRTEMALLLTRLAVIPIPSLPSLLTFTVSSPHNYVECATGPDGWGRAVGPPRHATAPGRTGRL